MARDSKPLVISSNLDALLEHDRQTRPEKHRYYNSLTGSKGSVVENEPRSLPPPPRQPRRLVLAPPASRPTPQVPRSLGSSSPNPYVNPSPSFNSRRRVVMSSGWSSPTSEPRSSLEKSKPDDLQGNASKKEIDKMQHVRQSSVFSTTSTETESSLDEQRISISSTVRFASSEGHSRLSFIDLIDEIPESPKSFMSLQDTKPPIPTTPKPDFSSRPPKKQNDRSDLIRKSRKLAQVFGQTPQASALTSQDSSFLDLKSQRRQSHNLLNPTWPADGDGTQYVTASGRRRHSTPLTPEDFSFLGADEILQPSSPSDFVIDIGTPKEDTPSIASVKTSTTSFMNLSDDEDTLHSPTTNPRPPGKRRASPTPSDIEDLSPGELADEERRRKREKLAKLHRFLGSRVPTDLALGVEEPGVPLPPFTASEMGSIGEDPRKAWIRRRRSSSAAALQTTYSDELVRLQEDLNDEEKAINVRRAIKMEKVFGVAPPQTLYHTRHCPSPSLPASKVPTLRASPGLDLYGTFPSVPTRTKSKKNDRPGTSDSTMALLPKASRVSEDTVEPTTQDRPISLVYTHYQHSLNSLNDILDRDDRESLAELHQYLNGDQEDIPSPTTPTPRDRRTSLASIKSERRRSLPTKPSFVSLASEYNAATPQPEATDFQLRRRRAAKLTQFFGVDYRTLIRDVLDSIENGLEHEQRRGTINPEEAEILLQKLRTIKTKRPGII